MSIARDEIFGPVLTVMPFDTLDEAIAIANDTVYGLAASVWTKNIDKALTVTRRVTRRALLGQHHACGRAGTADRRVQAIGLGPRGGHLRG